MATYKRDNLRKQEVENTLQKLLDTHNIDAILSAIGKLSGKMVTPEPVEIIEKSVTFEASKAVFKASGEYNEFAETTKDTYEYELNSLNKELIRVGLTPEIPLITLVKQHPKMFTAFIASVKSENSRNKRRSFLRKFLRIGLQYSGLLDQDIDRIFTESKSIYGIREIKNKSIKYLDLKQVKEVVNLSFLEANGMRNLVMFVVFLASGLRISELLNLKIENIDLEEQILMARRKNHKDVLRRAYIHEEALCLLHVYVVLTHGRLATNFSELKSKHGDKFIFSSSKDNKPISARGVQKMFERVVFKALTIPDEKKRILTPHSLRHTFAVTGLKNGVDVFSLKEFLDHSTLAMVSHYLRLTNRDYLDEINNRSILNNLLEGK